MAFTLLRLMTVFLAIAMIHLSSGLMLEAREYDSGSEEPSGKESLTFRAARIIGTLSESTLTLIFFCIYLTLTLVPLCIISGLDGSRVRRPKAFKKFR